MTDERGNRIATVTAPLKVEFRLAFLFDKAALDDLRVTLTRTVLVVFAASLSATAMDFIK